MGTVLHLLHSVGNEDMKTSALIAYVPKYNFAVHPEEVLIDTVFQLAMNLLTYPTGQTAAVNLSLEMVTGLRGATHNFPITEVQ